MLRSVCCTYTSISKFYSDLSNQDLLTYLLGVTDVYVNVNVYSALSHSASNALGALNTAETDESSARGQSWRSMLRSAVSDLERGRAGSAPTPFGRRTDAATHGHDS